MEKHKVLYVDDEDINRLVFEINLSGKYEILIAESGPKGLETIANNKDIMVVVSDMKMPEMNGLEFIAKAKGKYPLIKYFILTGYEITKEIKEALDKKLILNHFKKPFNIAEIDSAISKAIEAK